MQENAPADILKHWIKYTNVLMCRQLITIGFVLYILLDTSVYNNQLFFISPFK